MRYISTIRALLLLAPFLLSSSPAHASISISPAFVEVDLEKGRPSGQFEITNAGEEEQRYRINAIHFIFLREGGLREVPPDERSLAPWIRFNPREFVLPPKTRQVVRFVVTPKGALKNGEYWAAMELESLKTTVGRSKDKSGHEFNIEVIPSIIVPIFGKSGDVVHAGEIREAKLVTSGNSRAVETFVANKGSGRLFVTGEYQVTDASGKVVEKGPLGHGYILRGMERRFVAPLKDPAAAGDVVISYKALELDKPLGATLRAGDRQR